MTKREKRFKEIVLMCQKARKRYGVYYEEKYKKHIDKFSKEIIEQDLLKDCDNQTFAKQLCMMNKLNY